MPDLLVEIRSQEIPAQLQQSAAEQLGAKLLACLDSQQIDTTNIQLQPFYSPRRLAVSLRNCPQTTPAIAKSRRGPLVTAPSQVKLAFQRANNITDLEQLGRIKHKGREYYQITQQSGGQNLRDLWPVWLNEIIWQFNWPRRMRFADYDLYWIRPLLGIVMVWEGQSIKAGIALKKSPEPIAKAPQQQRQNGTRGNTATANSASENAYLEYCEHSRGHFMFANDPVKFASLASYLKNLSTAGVIVDPARRQQTIAQFICKAARIDKLPDNENESDIFLGITAMTLTTRIAELANLAEAPLPVCLPLAADYQQLPPALLGEILWQQQKIICWQQTQTDNQQPAINMLFVIDRPAEYRDEKIVASLDRVVRARLDDALQLLSEDQVRFTRITQATPEKLQDELQQFLQANRLDASMAELQIKLTQQLEQQLRLAPAFTQLAEIILLQTAFANTALVEEYPAHAAEIHRLLYTANRNRPDDGAIAHMLQALADNPKFIPLEQVAANPRDIANQQAALIYFAAELTRLVVLSGQHGLPRGNQDPFAIRSCSYGLLTQFQQLAAINSFSLRAILRLAVETYWHSPIAEQQRRSKTPPYSGIEQFCASLLGYFIQRFINLFPTRAQQLIAAAINFDQVDKQGNLQFADGFVIVAVLTELYHQQTESIATLVQLAKRISNILRKSDADNSVRTALETVNPELFQQPQETNLWNWINELRKQRDQLATSQDRHAFLHHYLTMLTQGSAHIADFFEHVMVNCEAEQLRSNRLTMLRWLVSLLQQPIDFLKLHNLRGAEGISESHP